MIMFAYFVIIMLAFVYFIGNSEKVMEFFKKYWREFIIGVLLITTIILLTFIFKDPLNKKYKEQNRVLDSLILESIKVHKLLADSGKVYSKQADSLNKEVDTVFVIINKTKKEKDEIVESINYLDATTVDKLFDSFATEYRLTKKRPPE